MRRIQTVFFAQMLLILAFMTITGCGNNKQTNTDIVSLTQGATANATLQIANASLQLNDSTTVTATYLDLNGRPIANLPVAFSTTFGSLNPSGGAAVTNAAGSATVQLLAGSSGGTGAVTATAVVSGVKISSVASFSVAFPKINLSTPVLGVTTSLAPGGSTSVTVNLTDTSGNPFLTPVDVNFSSNFSAAGTATLISPVRSVVSTVNGVTTATASSTYTAAGGVGNDTITVSVGGTSVSVPITVNGVSASSISFVSASPQSIALKGMGGVGGSETSTVIFKVLDTNGKPKQGQQVDFSLNTTVGGLSLTSTSASSAADGTVSTIVQSGIVATPVRVTASIHGSSPLIATQSDQLTVSTGIPTQDGTSLAVTTHNVEAFDIDGVSDTFTVFLADHFGNPVPDGTAVNFSAQVGQIQPSCLTVNGRCSAVWTSSGARTADGRAAILAYAIGEESFTDANGNGVADGPDQATCLSLGSLQASVVCGEFTDTTQAWRDDAHSGAYVSGDFFVDFNGSGKVDRDGIFNGILRPASVSGPMTKHVFSNNVIVMSTSAAKINALVNGSGTATLSPATVSGTTTTPASTVLTGSVQDLNGNVMAAGTQIALVPQGTCLTLSPSSFTVPSSAAKTTTYSTVVTNSCVTGTGTPGAITVNVTSPAGLLTSKSFTYTW